MLLNVFGLVVVINVLNFWTVSNRQNMELETVSLNFCN